MFEATPLPIAAGSLVIGVITFIVTEVGKWRRARRSETRQWQLDTIGTILSEQKSTYTDFDDIKSRYLRAADTYKDFNITKRYKQDVEIHRALFELQSKNVVSQDSAGHYRIRRDETKAELDEKFSKVSHDLKKLLDDVMQNVMAASAEQQKNTMEQIAGQQKSNLEQITGTITNLQNAFVSLLERQDQKIETYYNEEQRHKNIQKALLELIAKKPGIYNAEEACVEIMDITKQDRVYVMIQLINLWTTGIIRPDNSSRLRIALYAIKTNELIALEGANVGRQ